MDRRQRNSKADSGHNRGGFEEGKCSEDDNDKTSRVVALALAKAEGYDILTEFQYLLVVGLVQRLCDFGNKEATADLDIAPFGDFWELKLKGGFLKKINLRIYFAHIPSRKEIVILKAYKKEEDRRVSPHVIVTVEDRFEDYVAGRMGKGLSTYEREPGS
jgi:hypothetical protein